MEEARQYPVVILSVGDRGAKQGKAGCLSSGGVRRRWAARWLGLSVVMAAVIGTRALAADVPSGQRVTLHEVLVDHVGTEAWLRFRFIAPDLSKAADYTTAEADMAHLCTQTALPYMREFDLEGQMIVISLADRKTEFGTPDPEATQFFEAYRPVDNICIWEGL